MENRKLFFFFLFLKIINNFQFYNFRVLDETEDSAEVFEAYSQRFMERETQLESLMEKVLIFFFFFKKKVLI